MRIKRMLAREGLILLGFIIIGISGYLIINFRYDLIQIGNAGCLFLLIGYPIYLIIRFIVWAIKTLKR